MATTLLAVAFAMASTPGRHALPPGPNATALRPQHAGAGSGGRAQCRARSFELGGGDPDIVEAWHALRGPDGVSRVERVALPGKRGSYFGGSVKLTQFALGQPDRVVLVNGSPNMTIPPHAAPYREIFIILAGSSQMIMPDGGTIELKPGSLFIADDVGVTKARGGRSGPCGYIALDLQFNVQPLPEFRSSPEFPSSYDKK